MSSQPPDGRHVTDLAEILHTILDIKKNPGTRRRAFCDLLCQRYGSVKFPIHLFILASIIDFLSDLKLINF